MGKRKDCMGCCERCCGLREENARLRECVKHLSEKTTSLKNTVGDKVVTIGLLSVGFTIALIVAIINFNN